MPDDAEGPAALADRLTLLPQVVGGRNLGAHPPRAARPHAPENGERGKPDGRHPGQPVGPHQRKRGVRGYDGHKKLNGRKRHALVETSGLLPGVKILPANQNDRRGGEALLTQVRPSLPRLQHIWADQGYKGQFQHWAHDTLGLELEAIYPWWRQLERYLPEVYEQLGPASRSSLGAGWWSAPSRGGGFSDA